MLRAYKTVFTLIVISLAAVSYSGIANAMPNDVTTVEGDVTGTGATSAASKANAEFQLAERVSEVQQGLEFNQFIVFVDTSNSGHVLPTIYLLNYEIWIYTVCDNGGGGTPEFF